MCILVIIMLLKDVRLKINKQEKKPSEAAVWHFLFNTITTRVAVELPELFMHSIIKMFASKQAIRNEFLMFVNITVKKKKKTGIFSPGSHFLTLLKLKQT